MNFSHVLHKHNGWTVKVVTSGNPHGPNSNYGFSSPPPRPHWDPDLNPKKSDEHVSCFSAKNLTTLNYGFNPPLPPPLDFFGDFFETFLGIFLEECF